MSMDTSEHFQGISFSKWILREGLLEDDIRAEECHISSAIRWASRRLYLYFMIVFRLCTASILLAIQSYTI